jgi:hypothetical protein
VKKAINFKRSLALAVSRAPKAVAVLGLGGYTVWYGWRSILNRDFEIIGEITQVETIASGSGLREQGRFIKRYGPGRWRKLKGVARVRLVDGTLRLSEIHRYEAQGIGKIEFKLKLPFLDES